MSVPKWQVRKDRQGGSSTQTQAPMRRYLSYTSWKFKLTDLPSEITPVRTKPGKCLSRLHWCSHAEALVLTKWLNYH